ncbi:DsbA family oxidoreductase [Marinibaculum pumilum]|uniref:DsbA family oxidoreductase n=1 Tax=Marinibaculum pumilum TaxID=1766165 RepID=A0ABV7KY30_9PROT
MTETAAPLRIDIVSDVVCPWCIVGWRQLAAALERTGTPAEIHWHPFELNPNMAPEGQNLREHLAEKYGTSDADSAKARERLTAIGAELGFTFAYTDDMRMVNTFRAHQAIDWAETKGRAHEMKMALFAAFFTERRDVSDIDVLAELADGIGLDPAEARQVLEAGIFAEQVRQKEAFWTDRGLRGVPAVIFDRQHLATGAQGIDRYEAMLRQLTGQVAGQGAG